MTEQTAEQKLMSLWGEIRDLESAGEVLAWDQETQMPPAGVEGRATALATLAGVTHERLTSTALRDAIDGCAAVAEPGSVLAAQVREASRRVDRAVLVPTELTKELALAQSRGLAAWQSARKESDFALFEPSLTRMIELKREEAAAVAPDGNAYEALMDEFEPGSRVDQLEPLFDQLCDRLSTLVRAVADSGKVIDEAPARGHFPASAQLAFGRSVAEEMGFDFRAGRIDASTHPFCSGFNSKDVRLTWRHADDDFRPALFGIMHEAGHGLYEQGLPDEWQGTPIGGAVSLGFHESQSRLWENLVGRSRAFWAWALPHFHRAFPDTADRTVDELWPALHTVRPSYIRVEADQATYNLHIAVRFQLEKELFSGGLEVADLPGAWDDAYERLLGIRPRTQAEGVLQDIHWAMGAFGYFHTYTLGNLICAQLFQAAPAELGDLDELISRGEFSRLLGWLRDRVHSQGCRYTADELVERATGRPLTSDAFLASIASTVQQVYGVG